MTIICPWCGKEVGLTTSPLSEGKLVALHWPVNSFEICPELSQA